MDLGHELVQAWERREGRKANWYSHWAETSRFFIPEQEQLFSSQGEIDAAVGGEKRREDVFDSTPERVLGRSVSIHDSLLTPGDQEWHILNPVAEELKDDREVRMFFDLISRLLSMYRDSAESNFLGQKALFYESLIALGTGCLFIDENDRVPGLRYRFVHLSQITGDEDHQGRVRAVDRRFYLSAVQAVEMFGKDLPEQILKDAEKPGGSDRKWKFLHCVKPRKNPGARQDGKGMPWASYYVSIDGKQVLSESGYGTMPYIVSRYEQVPYEFFGRGEGMKCLPDVKTLNEVMKALLTQAHRIVDPVILGHEDGELDAFNLLPGAYNAGRMSAEGRRLVDVLPTGNVQVGRELMDDIRMALKEAFSNTFFELLIDKPGMTATEVLQRAQERGFLLVPKLSRQQTEFLGPMIEREVDVLASAGILPESPQALLEDGGRFRVRYENALARAKEAVKAAGIMQSWEQATILSNQGTDPSVFDHFNKDRIMPFLARNNDVAEEFLNEPKAIQAIRKQRAEQAQMEKMVEAAPSLAAGAKAIGLEAA